MIVTVLVMSAMMSSRPVCDAKEMETFVPAFPAQPFHAAHFQKLFKSFTLGESPPSSLLLWLWLQSWSVPSGLAIQETNGLQPAV